LRVAAKGKIPHALALCPRDDTTDSVLMRLVEEAHAASAITQIVIHPPFAGDANPMLDRRWASLLEQAMTVHADARLALRVPPPAGLR
jgi:hypothetical protein